MNNAASKNSSVTFREMTIYDYRKMTELWKRTPGIGLSNADSVDNIRIFFERNSGLSYICEIGNMLIGTVLCGHDGRRGYIYHLAVDDEQRRKGIGKELIKRCLDKLRQKGIAKCHLFLYSDNKDAVSFYEGTGWKRRDNLIIYSKDL
jgi:N-acetylglutamate synthase